MTPRRSGRLVPVTVKALDFAWEHQSEEGHWPGWVKCNWPPFESDDHYGATLIAIAVGMAPDNYRQIARVEAGMRRLKSYLSRHPPTHLHHKAMLLWAAKYVDGLGERRRTRALDRGALRSAAGGRRFSHRVFWGPGGSAKESLPILR